MKRLLVVLALVGLLRPALAANWNTLPDNISIPRSLAAAADSARVQLPDTTLSVSAKLVRQWNLYDPIDCWDVDRWREVERAGGLGFRLPDLGYLTISIAGDSLVLWDATTHNPHLVFLKGANNMLSNSTLNDAVLKDGVLHVVSGAGAFHIDLASGQCVADSSSAVRVYNGTFAQRNSGAGFQIGTTTRALLNVSCSAVSVNRNRLGKLDEGGRPLQDWAVSHPATGIWSAYNSDTRTIYSRASSALGMPWLSYDPKGSLAFAINDNPPAIFFHKNGVMAETSDGEDFQIKSTSFGASDVAWAGTNANIFKAGLLVPELSKAGGRSPLMVAGGDSSLYLFHTALYGSNAKQDTAGAKLKITSESNGPMEYGNTVLAADLGAVFSLGSSAVDSSPYLNHLVARGSTGHNRISAIVGRGDSLTANAYWERTSDSDFSMGPESFTFCIWFKSHSASNPASSLYLMEAYTNPDNYLLVLNSSGQLLWQISDDNDATRDNVTSSADFFDANWHCACGTKDGTSSLGLYVDKMLVGTASISAATAALDPSKLRIGEGIATTGRYFSGSIDDPVFYKGRALSAADVADIFDRGMSARQANVDPDDALPAADVVGLAATRNGYIGVATNIIAGPDSTDILNQYGIPIRRFAAPNDSNRSVALQEIGDSVGVMLGTKTRLRLVLPDPRLMQLAALAKQPALRPEQLANFAVIDTSGLRGLFFSWLDAYTAGSNARAFPDTVYEPAKTRRWGGTGTLASDAGVVEFSAFKTSTTSTTDTLILTPWIPYKFAGGYTTGITGEVNASCGCYNTSPLAGNTLLMHIGANTTNSHVTSVSNVTWDSGGGGSNGNCVVGNFIWGFNGNYARLLYLNTRGNGTQAAIYGKIVAAHNSP